MLRRYIIIWFICALLICPVAAVEERPKATSTIAPVDTTAYNQLFGALGGNETYNETAGTGEFQPMSLFDAAMYVWENSSFGDYGILLIIASPFLAAYIQTKDSKMIMTMGLAWGAFILIKVPEQWKLPLVGALALAGVAILYGFYKERY